MMTMNKIFHKLRNYNKRNYVLFIFCITLSVMLISSYAIMLYSTSIQNELPEGGDSRKMIEMIFVMTMIGCLLFMIYGTGIFLRYKSNEIGVFMALGAHKRQLKKALYTDILVILMGCVTAGLILGSILVLFVWQIYRQLLKHSDLGSFTYTAKGYGIGLLFCAISAFCIIVMAMVFMKRSNLMDILYAQRKSEPLKLIKQKYGISGIILLFAGIVIGYGGPYAAVNRGFRMPGIWSITYLLSLAGIYMFLVYVISHHERGRNPQKYYRNIIPYSMMKFQGKQTIRNMIILSLIIGCALIAGFFIPMTYAGVRVINASPCDYAILCRMDADVIGQEEIYQIADSCHVEITQYGEFVFAELIGSGVERDWNDDGSLYEKEYRQYKYFEFISASDYEAVTGENPEIAEGTYRIIIRPEAQSGFWYRYEDLRIITNPVNNQELKVAYAGTAEYLPFIRNGTNRYVLNDRDYAAITAGITENRQIKQILFNVADVDGSYDFAETLYEKLLEGAPANMRVANTYDEIQERIYAEEGKTYHYGYQLVMSPDNVELYNTWKYYPTFKVIYASALLKDYGIIMLLFLYVSVICLAAACIISYSRSLTIGLNNKQLFNDLTRLGANNKYVSKCIKSQLKKIFVIPAAVGSVIIFAYEILILAVNDRKFSSSDRWALMVSLMIASVVYIFLYLIYRISLKATKGVIGIK